MEIFKTITIQGLIASISDWAFYDSAYLVPLCCQTPSSSCVIIHSNIASSYPPLHPDSIVSIESEAFHCCNSL